MSKTTGRKSKGGKSGRPPRQGKLDVAVEAGLEAPTPEQRQRARFEIEPLVESGQITNVRAYRRKPLFETMAASGDRFTPSQMAAMRHYRQAFDRADRSYTSSCLDLDPAGRRRKPDSIIHAPDVIIAARDTVAACERAMGAYRNTVAAVVLDDRSFSEIAIERFGSRKQSRIEDEPPRIDAAGKQIRRKAFVEKIVPRSGRHRDIIRQEFVAGILLLTNCARRLVSTAGQEEVWVEADNDGTAYIRSGALAPHGSYRLYGSSGLVDEIVTCLRMVHGAELIFADYVLAREALDAACDGRLPDVDAHGVAA